MAKMIGIGQMSFEPDQARCGAWTLLAPGVLLALGACGGPGEVEPTKVLGTDGQLQDLAIDQERIFVTVARSGGSGEILSAPKGGGTPASVADTPALPGSLAVDESSVYFTAMGGGPYRVPKGGGASAMFLLGAAGDQPWGVAEDAGYVYWTTWIAQSGELGVIARADKVSGEVLALATDQDRPLRLALDETHVYWTNGDSGEGGVLRRVPQRGGDVVTLTAGASPDGFIAVDDRNVYFIGAGTNDLMAVPKAGGPSTLIAALSVGLGAMATDGERVYASGTDGIYVVERDGSSVERLAATSYARYGLALDARYVYWIGAGGTPAGVYRAPR